MENKFNNEQLQYLYSEQGFLIFINRYFSSFSTCIHKVNLDLDNDYITFEDLNIYLRILLANIQNLYLFVEQLEDNLSYSLINTNKNVTGRINGRLRIDQYIKNNNKIKIPNEYPCIVKEKSNVTPENIYLIFIIENVCANLKELKKYLITKMKKYSTTESYRELKEIDLYIKKFHSFSKKGYFVECMKDYNKIKRTYGNKFPDEKYNLINNRIRKRKIKNYKKYLNVFRWYEKFKDNNMTLINEDNMAVLMYNESFANKLFELWNLYSIKETLINGFNSNLIEEKDIMESSNSYIFKIELITGGNLEIYYQRGHGLYWDNQEDLSWKYRKQNGLKGLIGIPDISIRYSFVEDSLIMIDLKNRNRHNGENSEEIYKMIGYFSNFKKSMKEKYSANIVKQGILIFRNDKESFIEELVNNDGYEIKCVSVSPQNNDELNKNQFYYLCKSILNIQSMNGMTSEIFSNYKRNIKEIEYSTGDAEAIEQLLFQIGEKNHNSIELMFKNVETKDSLLKELDKIKENHFPHIWKKIHEDSRRILGMAESLYQGLTNCEFADYAPICLEYCRAVEVELNKLIFSPFRQEYDISGLMQRNRFYSKMLEDRDMTLGECLFFFEKCNHRTYPLIELKEFMGNLNINNEFFDKGLSILRILNVKVRRKSAHTTIMNYEELLTTRQIIFGIGYSSLFYMLLDDREVSE